MTATTDVRAWLVQTFRADVNVLSCYIPKTCNARARGQHVTEFSHLPTEGHVKLWESWGYQDIAVEPACRCYRCGRVLTAATLVVDTYGLDNVRPACDRCRPGASDGFAL